MLKIGHRGAKGYVAENTIDSFKEAFLLGADGIELDVQLSEDGEVVVIHDKTVDRTIANASGVVRHFTSDELWRLGDVPTLNKVLHWLPRNKFINIEIKDKKAAHPTVLLIDNFTLNSDLLYKNIVVSSFDWEILKVVSALEPMTKIGVLTEDNLEATFDFAKEIKAFSVNVDYKLLTPEFIEKSHQNKLQIHAWTVNSPEDITFVKNLGVDAIISDFPDRL
ncbi:MULTISPECIES: glycerophosphodiester phosphodiesterase [Flavobacterium]|uniref:Glycerophosphodiester phosphodiesterase n=1 Tax=Flavobacterium hankyongi TaxID=1176532 RepID=A0ABP8ZKR6_9FLAO|nr:glycerophosphodiester phosphodiesterase family protein [Flavobacterium sp. N1846]